MMWKAYVLQFTDVIHSIRVITLQLPKDRPYDFMPGQYAMLQMEGYDPRPFSIASAPRADHTIDIHVRNSGQNISEKLCETLKQGDTVFISAPMGKMVLQKNAAAGKAVFLAGGTGISPFLGMLEVTPPRLAISLYWGMTTEHDFYIRPHRNGLTVHYCTQTYPVDAYMPDLDLTATHYISGPPAMVRDSVSKLLSAGVEASMILYDD